MSPSTRDVTMADAPASGAEAASDSVARSSKARKDSRPGQSNAGDETAAISASAGMVRGPPKSKSSDQVPVWPVNDKGDPVVPFGNFPSPGDPSNAPQPLSIRFHIKIFDNTNSLFRVAVANAIFQTVQTIATRFAPGEVWPDARGIDFVKADRSWFRGHSVLHLP